MKFPDFSRVARGLIALWTLGAAGQPVWADPVVPSPFPAEHYTKMAAHSPFAPPTAPVATPPPSTPPPQPNFADRLTFTSWMQRNGVFSVTVVDPDNQQRLYLRTDQPTKGSDLQLVSVKLNPRAKDEPPVVTLRKGLASGTVRYEPGPGGAAAAPGAPTGIQRPGGGAPGNVINRPFTPPNIPGTPTAGVQTGPVNGPVNNLNRRPIIRSPQPPPATGGRPVVLPGNATSVPSTVKPGVNTDDDDDDD